MNNGPSVEGILFHYSISHKRIVGCASYHWVFQEEIVGLCTMMYSEVASAERL